MPDQLFTHRATLCLADCEFCHGRPPLNAESWADPNAPTTAQCPRCGGSVTANPVELALADTGRRVQAAVRGQAPTRLGRLVAQDATLAELIR